MQHHISEELKKSLEFYMVLDKRAKECKIDGHQLDENSERCGYYYEKLIDSTQTKDTVLKSKINLPLCKQLLNAGWLKYLKKEDIELQKSLDINKRISLLEKELSRKIFIPSQ